MQAYRLTALYQRSIIQDDVLKELAIPPLSDTSVEFLRRTGRLDDGG